MCQALREVWEIQSDEACISQREVSKGRVAGKTTNNHEYKAANATRMGWTIDQCRQQEAALLWGTLKGFLEERAFVIIRSLTH